MYCRKCGNPIKETDHTCKICGTPVLDNAPVEKENDLASEAEQAAAAAEEREKDDIEKDGEKKPVHHTEFNWNVYDFPKPRKTEDLDLQWNPPAEEKTDPGEKGFEEEQGAQKSSDAESKGAEKEKRESEVAVSPQGRGGVAEPTPEKKAEAEAVREESVREIEKFFTFSKKNEEFQKLLDREYEKLKNRREGEPYIEPALEFEKEADSFAEPQLSDDQSEFERMILEGTTSSEEAEPIEDFLRRRTIPVDLGKIQRKAEKIENPPEIPAYQISAKEPHEIERDGAIEADQEAVAAGEEEEAHLTGEGPDGEEDLSIEETTGEKGSSGCSAEDVSGKELERQLSEMAAARESFLRQLAEEKEALKRAEEEAARRRKLEKELRSEPRTSGSGPGVQAPRETLVHQAIPSANAEIQVTVAVKAGCGAGSGGTVSVVNTPIPGTQPYTQPAANFSGQGGAAGMGYDEGTPCGEKSPEVGVSHVIDAEAVEIREKEQERAEEKPPVENSSVGHPAPETVKTKEKSPADLDEPWHENTLNSLFAVEPVEAQPSVEEKKTGGKVAKIVLVIIAVILAVEILALGIKYFAPESSAAEAVRNMETQIVEFFSGIPDFFDGLSGGEKSPVPDGEENGGSEGQDAVTGGDGETGSGEGDNGEYSGVASEWEEPDPTPMADGEALIATQADKNKNILKISSSDSLKYTEGRNYGYSDINSSLPIENNIWKTLDSGEVLYYDRAVVGTLISFDSQWQDYVNSGVKDALSLLKEGSKAYQYASNYSKVGKEIQSFESLEIGEIRRGKSGTFYVWTKEQIKKTQNSQTKTVTYYWIYHMEPVGDQMKIVNYTKY